jgi:alkanesulfonate monooxygenase SsuD/methylene tetrahydromethanopterin reductase-like flavin-dependent oxidoreductase (luciferase family)
VCPGVYLRDVALPTMRAGAEKAGRPVPPLMAHAPICVHDKPDEVREMARQQLANYVRLPFYVQMLTAAGFPEASQGVWSDAMIETVVLSGDESRVAERLHELFSFGAAEILVSPLAAGSDRAASLERTLRLVAEVGTAVAT